MGTHLRCQIRRPSLDRFKRHSKRSPIPGDSAKSHGKLERPETNENEGNGTPNAVSLASILFATLSGIFFYLSLEESGDTCGPYLVAAAVFIQLRLLCNMLDGLIAVEGGLAGPLGEIYNDLPDRLADSLCFPAPIFFHHLTRYFFVR